MENGANVTIGTPGKVDENKFQLKEMIENQ
jgi:hypothetical protein